MYIITKSMFVFFSKPGCVNCVRAKEALNNNNFKYSEIDLFQFSKKFGEAKSREVVLSLIFHLMLISEEFKEKNPVLFAEYKQILKNKDKNAEDFVNQRALVYQKLSKSLNNIITFPQIFLISEEYATQLINQTDNDVSINSDLVIDSDNLVYIGGFSDLEAVISQE